MAFQRSLAVALHLDDKKFDVGAVHVSKLFLLALARYSSCRDHVVSSRYSPSDVTDKQAIARTDGTGD